MFKTIMQISDAFLGPFSIYCLSSNLSLVSKPRKFQNAPEYFLVSLSYHNAAWDLVKAWHLR